MEGNEIILIDVLKSEGDDVIDTIQLNMELEKVKKYIDVLDEREKEVIISRFGLDLQKEKTQREIAKELGISRSNVSRIEKRALMKMFHEFYRNEKEKRRVIFCIITRAVSNKKRPLFCFIIYFASTLTSALIINAIDTVITIPITIANIPCSSLNVLYIYFTWRDDTFRSKILNNL